MAGAVRTGGDTLRGSAALPSRASVLLLTLLALSLAFSFGAAAQKKHPPATPVDLNTATIEQLEQIPQIGAATAKSIVNFREKSGPFRKVDELLAIKTISPAKLEKIRPYLTVAPRS